MSVASLGTLRRRAEQQIAPCSRVPSNSTVSYRVVSYRTAHFLASVGPSRNRIYIYIYIYRRQPSPQVASSPSNARRPALVARPRTRAGRSRTDPFPPPQRSGLHPDHAPGPHPTSTPGTTAHVHPSSESTPGAQKWYVGSHTASTTLPPPSSLPLQSLSHLPLPSTLSLPVSPPRPPHPHQPSDHPPRPPSSTSTPSSSSSSSPSAPPPTRTTFSPASWTETKTRTTLGLSGSARGWARG